MIKIASRPNLKYPLYLIISTFLRKIISILNLKLLKTKESLIYTFLMFFGELLAGFLLYRYQKNFTKRKYIRNEFYKFLSSPHFQKRLEMKKADSNIKICFLVFMTAFFDFFEFIISTYYINKIPKISETLELRLAGILIFISSFLYRYLFKFPLYKHQKFSMSVIGICLIILIISEYFFDEIDEDNEYKNLTIAILLSILSQMAIAFNNTIEKYLMEFNFLNPFFILLCQSSFGLIFVIICAIVENPIPDLKNIYDSNSMEMFIVFIILLLLYFVFGALKNIYRIITIMLFNPMNKQLADIIINPIYITYFFIEGGDFIKEGKRNYFYFFTNIFLLICFDIGGLIFNEFIIIFSCGLDFNTYESIVKRAAEADILGINQEDEEEEEKKSKEFL